VKKASWNGKKPVVAVAVSALVAAVVAAAAAAADAGGDWDTGHRTIEGMGCGRCESDTEGGLGRGLPWLGLG
jgi:hypothetical protein